MTQPINFNNISKKKSFSFSKLKTTIFSFWTRVLKRETFSLMKWVPNKYILCRENRHVLTLFISLPVLTFWIVLYSLYINLLAQNIVHIILTLLTCWFKSAAALQALMNAFPVTFVLYCSHSWCGLIYKHNITLTWCYITITHFPIIKVPVTL